MIESLSHLPTSLGAIQSLDLSRNRIQSLAGLERLKALQSIDISRNHIDDATELYRLTGLPHLSLLVVGTGNTLEKSHSKFSWRVETYLAFARENNSSISVDGIGPSWSESRTISAELARIPPRKTYSHSISPDQVSVRPPSEPREPVASTSTPQAPHDNERDSVHVASPVKPSTKPKPKKKRKPVGRVVQIDDSMQQRQLGTETAESEPNFEQDEEAHGTSHEGHATTRAHQRSASEQAYRAPQHQHQRHRTIGQSSSDETVAPAGTHTTPNEATDGFRRRIEMLRAEGGEDWLRYVEARSK